MPYWLTSASPRSSWRLAKVSLFVISLMSKSFNLENTVGKGTHGFMAPETYEEVYSVKADIFSLGATIYAVANLKRPYKGEAHQIMFKLNVKKAAPEEFAEHCPDSLCPLLLLNCCCRCSNFATSLGTTPSGSSASFTAAVCLLV